MSTPFSTVEKGTEWQSAEWINSEIINPLNERLKALLLNNTAWIPEVVSGEEIQLATFWSAIQSKINSYAVYLGSHQAFVDHINGPIKSDKSDWLYWTVSSLHAAAHGGSNFRRSTDGVSFSEGLMEPGDEIGQWIFSDIISCLNLLRYCIYDYSFVTSEGTKFDYYYGASGYEDSPSAAKSAASADFAFLSTQAGYTSLSASAVISTQLVGGITKYVGVCIRTVLRFHVIISPSVSTAKSVSIYHKTSSAENPTDIDGYGFTGPNQIFFVQNLGEITSSDWITESIGSTSDPMAGHPGTVTTTAYVGESPALLCDYHFTKQT